MIKDLTIIIPAHNEEKRISPTLDKYLSFFEKMKRENQINNYNIIIVLNNTSDKTEDIINEYQKLNVPLSYLKLIEGGKGLAVMAGFKEALKGSSHLIGFVDADCATTPEEYFKLASSLNGCDGIIASRYLRGSIVNPTQSLKRIIVSRIFNLSIRLLFPEIQYKDTQCGAKIFKRNALSAIIDEVGTTQWAFDVDLLYQLVIRGYQIKEQATIWRDKEYSKLNLKKAGLKMVLALFRLRLWHSKLRWIVYLYNKLPEWIKIHHKI